MFKALLVLLCLALASGEDCDKLGVLLYEDLGCIPEIKPGETCPRKFQCEEFKSQSANCTFRSKVYKFGEYVDNDLINSGCNTGCLCETAPNFLCAILDCPEWLNGPLKENCYRKYDVNLCCSTDKVCTDDTTSLAKCNVDGQEILEGQKFRPKETCLTCVCQKGYEGKNEAPFCRRNNCAVQLRNSHELVRNCAPAYGFQSEALCCPSYWICPTGQDVFEKISTKEANSDLTCKFGEKTVNLGEGFRRGELVCECSLPPLLTCKETSTRIFNL